MLREFLAPNASPMTLEGTRTYLVGRERVAIIDPGSADSDHIAALVEAVGEAACVAVLVTHRHPDHSAGAADLARRLDAPLRTGGRKTLVGGDEIETDAGTLVATATPGHTPDHMALHWLQEDAVFCGDLMMGGSDTSLVAPPEGNLGQYLASLERVRELRPRVIHPAHGPSFEDPHEAIGRYIQHRVTRLRQVQEALDAGATSADAVVNRVYGSALEEHMRAVARGAVEAYLAYLRARGRPAGAR